MAGPNNRGIAPRFGFAPGFQKVIYPLGYNLPLVKPHVTEKLEHPPGLGGGACATTMMAVIEVRQGRFTKAAIGILKTHQCPGGHAEIRRLRRFTCPQKPGSGLGGAVESVDAPAAFPKA